MQQNTEKRELRMECTGCSNYCALRVQIENGAIIKIEDNGCRRAFICVKRQLGIPLI